MNQPEIEMNCGNCVHFLGNKDTHSEQGHCRRNPPVAYPFPAQGIAGGQPKIFWQSTFPPVHCGMKCGEHLLNEVVPDDKTVRIGPEKLEN